MLFEVETDKATMEVEAGADGFLTDVRAEAGDDVPVGNVIALIADSSEAADSAEAPAEAAAGGRGQCRCRCRCRAGRGADEAAIEGAEVIMPALGMAQDTGTDRRLAQGAGRCRGRRRRAVRGRDRQGDDGGRGRP